MVVQVQASPDLVVGVAVQELLVVTREGTDWLLLLLEPRCITLVVAVGVRVIPVVWVVAVLVGLVDQVTLVTQTAAVVAVVLVFLGFLECRVHQAVLG